MPLDPDRTRVDLIKAKRKVYLSYPSESPERKSFLLVAKMSEIEYLTKMIPVDVATYIVGDYETSVKMEMRTALASLFVGAFLSSMLYLIHTVYPHSALLNFWCIGWFLGTLEMVRHGLHIKDLRKKVKPFLDEYNRVKEKLEKLNEELKRLK